jgi:hypothetical protein
VGARARRGREAQARAALHPVEPRVRERNLRVGTLGRVQGAVAVAMRAAHLEHVGEVGRELDLEREPDRLLAVVRDLHVFVIGRLPQELGTEHVQRAVRDLRLVGRLQVRVHQVDGEHDVVFAHGRAEQQQRLLIDAQPERREEARALVVQTVRAAHPGAADVAVAIEHGERVALLEYARAGQRERRHRQDLVAVLDVTLDHADPCGFVHAAASRVVRLLLRRSRSITSTYTEV